MNKDDYDKNTGSFTGDNDHKLDKSVINNLIDFCAVENVNSVLDLGCGWSGGYVEALREKNIDCIGYDGNPLIKEQNKPYLKHLLLNEPFSESFKKENKRDLILSLEVGEHIPKKFQDIYVDNLASVCDKYLIVSWALPSQGGLGHVNEMPKSMSRELFKKRGFKTMWIKENIFCKTAQLSYFKNTIMVFEK